MPGLIHAKLCTDNYFYMTYNSSFVSHFIRETFFLSNHTILKNGIKCLFINRQKMHFKMKWSPSKGASVYKVSSNSEKILLPKKHQRGKPSKFFGSTKKKKIYLTNVVEPANRSQHTKLFRVQVFSYELLSFMSWGHICHPTVHVRVKPSICMNSGDHWLQGLEKAFPQEIT